MFIYLYSLVKLYELFLKPFLYHEKVEVNLKDKRTLRRELKSLKSLQVRIREWLCTFTFVPYDHYFKEIRKFKHRQNQLGVRSRGIGHGSAFNPTFLYPFADLVQPFYGFQLFCCQSILCVFRHMEIFFFSFANVIPFLIKLCLL